MKTLSKDALRLVVYSCHLDLERVLSLTCLSSQEAVAVVCKEEAFLFALGSRKWD